MLFRNMSKTSLQQKYRRRTFIKNEKGKIIIKVRSLELIITLPHIEFQVEFIYRYLKMNENYDARPLKCLVGYARTAFMRCLL